MKTSRWTDRIISDFAQRRCHTYPHCNGFADGGNSLVLAQIETAHTSLWKYDLASGGEQLIRRFAGSVSWVDVARVANVMIVESEGALWLLDLDHLGEGRAVYRQPEGSKSLGMPSISADGTSALVPYERAGRRGAMLVDIASGQAQPTFEHDWWANHAHFSPYDPTWIFYCHEGWIDLVPDRMWAWHKHHVPQGRCIFDQASSVPGKRLRVGHEVGCVHDASALVVAYGSSEAGPRGLYEIFLDGRKPQLISEGDRDLHCHPSACGQWAVLDSSGPHDADGRGWENSQKISDIILVNKETGQRTFLARSRITQHPWHSHPAFSPNGRYIVYCQAGVDDPSTGSLHVLERSGTENAPLATPGQPVARA